MKYTKYALVLGMAIALCPCPMAWGNITNGGFETGNLSGWYSQGVVQAVGWEYSRDWLLAGAQEPFDGFWDPTEGGYFASLWSQEEDFYPHTDSILRQTFETPGPGYRLEFDYFYDFGDGEGYWATAYITVMDGVGNPIWTLSINDPVADTDLEDDENIDWTTASVLLPSTGTYTLEFHLNDHPFGGFLSILGVDNVRVIPAPGAIVLGMIGMATVGFFRRSRRSG